MKKAMLVTLAVFFGLFNLVCLSAQAAPSKDITDGLYTYRLMDKTYFTRDPQLLPAAIEKVRTDVTSNGRYIQMTLRVPNPLSKTNLPCDNYTAANPEFAQIVKKMQSIVTDKENTFSYKSKKLTLVAYVTYADANRMYVFTFTDLDIGQAKYNFAEYVKEPQYSFFKDEYELAARQKADAEELAARQKAEAAAEKQRITEEQNAKQIAERQRQETEKVAAEKLTREQVLKKLKLDGSYIISGKSNWHALKFVDEKDNIKVLVVYNDGSGETTALYGCGIDGSTLTVGPASFTILSNGNLQFSSNNMFVYVPFSGVKGKAYSRIRGRGDLSYSFTDSRYVVKTSNGRIIDESERTYEYANGEISFKHQGTVFSLLSEVGPFLVSSTGIWKLDS